MNDLTLWPRRRCLQAGAALLLAPATGLRAQAPAVDPRDSGPLSLAVQLQVRAADRPRLRSLMQRSGVPQYERWRQQGLLAGHQILFNRYADAPHWDLMLALHFARYADLARWHAIEQRTPAGLPPAALALATAVHTTPMDRMRQGRAEQAARHPTLLVVPYDYLVSTREYMRYVDGYLVPQVDGWVAAGIVSGWGLYLARYGAGRAWSSLFVIEYRDDESLGSRDRVVAQVRAGLANQAEWKRWSDEKDKIRTEGAPVVADDLALG